MNEVEKHGLSQVDILSLLCLNASLAPPNGCAGGSLVNGEDPNLELFTARYIHMVRYYHIKGLTHQQTLINNAQRFLQEDFISRWSQLIDLSPIACRHQETHTWSCCEGAEASGAKKINGSEDHPIIIIDDEVNDGHGNVSTDHVGGNNDLGRSSCASEEVLFAGLIRPFPDTILGWLKSLEDTELAAVMRRSIQLAQDES